MSRGRVFPDGGELPPAAAFPRGLSVRVVDRFDPLTHPALDRLFFAACSDRPATASATSPPL